MDHTLKRHSHLEGRHILAIHRELGHTFRAALLERQGNDWRVVSSSSGGLAWPGDLESCTRQMGVPATCKQAVVLGESCLPMLQEVEVPAGLAPSQAQQMLRWEMASALASSELPGEETEPAGPNEWEISYAAAGTRRTVTVAMRPAWIEKNRQDLAAHGWTLAAVLPFLTLGWLALSSQDGGFARSAALVQRSGSRVALSIFEHGRLEFYSIYDMPSETWPRTLLADARSFALEKLLLCGSESDSLRQMPPPGLPAPELLGDAQDLWLWTGAARACLGASVCKAAQMPPIVALLSVPTPTWQKPAVWWLAAAAAIALTGSAAAINWLDEFQTLKEDHQRTLASVVQTETQLRAYDADAEMFEKLQAELRNLEMDISQAQSDSEKPGSSRCAQVEYISDALHAISQAFFQGVRLEKFRTDYEGNVAFSGKALHDASVQEALGRFYDLMKRHPVHPARLTTKRDESSTTNRVVFTAEDAPGSGRAADPAIEILAEEAAQVQTASATLVAQPDDTTAPLPPPTLR